MKADKGIARTGPLHWIVPSLGSVLALTALANALFFRGHHLFAFDGDVGRHIRVGRAILASGSIPRADLFSFTRADAPFIAYEWLAETLTALADSWLGLAGVAALSALLYVVAVLAVYRTSEALGAARPVAFGVAIIALLLQSVHLLPRPHLFTTALASVYMLLLVRFARSGRAWSLAPLPLLMLVWANVHGGFLMGFVLLGAFVAGAILKSAEFAAPQRALRALLLVALVCGGASLVNPAGLSLWSHTTGYLGIDFLVDATREYQSIDFHQGYGKAFFVALFTGPVLWMTGRVRVTPLAAGLYLLFAAAALHSSRNIPLFTVAALPWLGVWIVNVLEGGGAGSRAALERLRRFETTDRLLRPGFAAVASLALLWIAVIPASDRYGWDPRVFPVNALQAMGDELPDGHVFNQMIWGGYLLYERDDVPVFIDGQTDFYGEELSRDYLTVLKGRSGWDDVLEKYGIAWTMTPAEEPINQLLELDPRWELVSSDGVAVIYRRRGR